MSHDAMTLGFPLWLRIAHWLNFLLLTLLVRSGIQILADHPRLYWTVDSNPDRAWLKFTGKTPPTDRVWTSMDEAVNVSPWIAIPGGWHNLGLGRHWHFFCVIFWILNGLIYVGLLFGTGEWIRLLPTSWNIIPRAFHTMVTYMTFHLPAASELHPYDPLQQLAYAFVVFVMAPLTILTGASMSPALVAHWPWFEKFFGNRQIARSIHFLLMVGYLIFIVIHVSLVVITGFSRSMNHMILGGQSGGSNLAVAIGLLVIALVVLLHAFANWSSQVAPRAVQTTTGMLVDTLMRLCFARLTSRQQYTPAAISPYFWVNGSPPATDEYKTIAEQSFAKWKLQIYGLVESPLSMSLPDLLSFARQRQITLHNCIQGWSGVAEWGGAPLREILKMVKPLPQARYAIFHSYGIDEQGREYYGSLNLEDANHPQTILAYEMNGKPLPIEHGAPLRLRVETKLGFKMVKYLKSIELVEDYRTVGLGYGGYREDCEFYGTMAGI